MAITCQHCGKGFTRESSLTRHTKNVHEENLLKHACKLCKEQYKHKESLNTHLIRDHNMESKDEYVLKCKICSFTTLHRQSLTRHNKKHQVKTTSFCCKICNAKFCYKTSLTRHEEKVHQKKHPNPYHNKCPFCSISFHNKKKQFINSHLDTIHKKNMSIESHKFTSIQEFYQWKASEERKTTTKFMKICGGTALLNFSCHRSGYYSGKGNGKRALKIMGSCKINAYCPAYMTCKVKSDGCVNVEYQRTHLGHKCELKHVTLSLSERQQVAIRLAEKVPPNEVLNEVRSSLSDQQLHRIHLINKQDIKNIEASFNLNSQILKHKYDPLSIAAWVETLKTLPTTSLLVFKPQGILSETFPTLKKEDFLLIYMSRAQKEILARYGSDVICIDGTHGTNSYDFQLYTILTVEECREGFPVCFMFSNRADESVMSIYFQNLKDTVGVVTPTAFMSDMDDTFYTAWEKVMGRPTLRLYCAWHVIRAWKKNIRKKIKNKDNQDNALKIVQVLLYELDRNTFHILLEAGVSELESNEDTSDFAQYLKANYIQNDQFTKWAYCYRLRAGINTNMYIENFNKLLKYCYLKGKKVKRLDISLCAILDLLKNKLFDLVIKMHKGKVVTKLKILRHRHRASLNLESEKVIKEGEDMWQVLSSSNTELYQVVKVKSCKKCLLLCAVCNACFHEYICSCHDSSIRNNMCKHIHLVAQQCCQTLSIRSDTEPLLTNVIENQILSELSLVEDHEDETIAEKKKALLEQLKILTEDVTTNEEVEFIKQHLKLIKPMLAAMKSSNCSFHAVNSEEQSQPSLGGNIVPQRRFFSTKKKTLAKSEVNKSEELQKVAIELLNRSKNEIS